VYDGGEHEILFVGEDDPPIEPKYSEHAAVYIKPRSGTAAGLGYIYRKLQEKFDSRTHYEIVDKMPYDEVA
jgi:hypothetical protein